MLLCPSSYIFMRVGAADAVMCVEVAVLLANPRVVVSFWQSLRNGCDYPSHGHKDCPPAGDDLPGSRLGHTWVWLGKIDVIANCSFQRSAMSNQAQHHFTSVLHLTTQPKPQR